jgi:radical SAM enzyme (TIGR01210 family)
MEEVTLAYGGERNRLLRRNLRSDRSSLDPLRHQGTKIDLELGPGRCIRRASTLFLTGMECPFHCSMCDLWQFTLAEATPVGALAHQIEEALGELSEPCDWIKLYNASNFFDPRAVPEEDYGRITEAMAPFERVVVENHPRLIGSRMLRFQDQLRSQLEIAMGLETVHPASIAWLDKQMSLEDFEAAMEFCGKHGIDRRVFLILQPPGTPPEEAVDWGLQAAKLAASLGARHISMIPLRAGNGVIDRLLQDRSIQLPDAAQLEQWLFAAQNLLPDTVVTVDLWDWDRLSGHCVRCSQPRLERLHRMNLRYPTPPLQIPRCHCDIPIFPSEA